MKYESQNSKNNKGLIRSFGRIKSRKLSDHKSQLLKELLPSYEIKNFPRFPLTYKKSLPETQSVTLLDYLCPEGMKDKNFNQQKVRNCLEIGFGFGDFIFTKSKNNPDINFFGSEPHLNGVVNLLAKLEDNPLKNLQISTEDVRLLLLKFPEQFFDQVFILFPDPWPKFKHFKRRLINQKFLDEVLSIKMKNGAQLFIVTDHDSYKTWILNEVSKSKKFIWNANSKKDWQIFPNDWTFTKYQKKAEIEGRTSVIFNLTKHD